MERHENFYIDGEWVAAQGSNWADVINPATEKAVATIALGAVADVDRAVAAARAAFPRYAVSTPAERLELIRAIDAEYRRRSDDLVAAVHTEMGAPERFAAGAQVPIGGAHIAKMIEVLETFSFEKDAGEYRLRKEPIGVCALITPWNWPLNQIACKVMPALAAGCVACSHCSQTSARKPCPRGLSSVRISSPRLP